MAGQEVSYIIRARDAYSAIHKGADQAVDRTAKNLKKATGVMTVAVGAVSASLYAMMKTTANSGDHLSKLEARLGISAEGFSSLAYAAEMSDISMTTLEMSMQRQTRRLSEAAQGTGQAVSALKTLGLTAKDLKDMKPEEAFMKIAAEMEKVPSKADRARIAMQLWDTEGVKLNQMIAAGTENIEAMRERAEMLGLTFDSKAAAAAARFNDEIADLGYMAIGVKNTFSKELIPYFGEFGGLINESLMEVKKSGDLDVWAADMAGGVITSFEAMVGFITNVPMAWNALMVSVKTSAAGILAALKPVVLIFEKWEGQSGGYGSADMAKKWAEKQGKVVEETKSLSDQIDELAVNLLVSADANEVSGEKWGEWALKAQTAIGSVRNKVEESLISGAASGANLKNNSATGEQTAPIAAANDAVYGPELSGYQNFLQQKITAHEKAQAQIKASEAGTYMTAITAAQTNLASIEQYHQNKIQMAWVSGASQTEIAKLNAQAEVSMEKAKNDAKLRMGRAHLQAATGFMHNLFVATGSSNKKMFDAYKTFATGEAIISTYKGASKALGQGGFFGIAMAASVIAQGMMQVKQIQSQTMGGGASGSSVSAGGAVETSPTVYGDTGAGSLIGRDQGNQQKSLTIKVNFNSTIANSEQMAEFVESDLLPIMKDAQGRDVVLDYGSAA